MATAMEVGVSSSPFFCATTIQLKQFGASSTDSTCRPAISTLSNRLVVCQKDNGQLQEADITRRCFTVAAAAATTLGIFTQPEAQAGKRKPPPVQEKKVESDDKGMSAYDQRLLATARRKEAMKANVEAQKEKAKSIASSK